MPSSAVSGYGSSQATSVAGEPSGSRSDGGPCVSGSTRRALARLAGGVREGVVAVRERGDPVEPAAKGGASLEPIVPAPGAQERLLYEVLGVVERPEHA